MKKLIAAILIILMISLLSITSFAQVLPEGYPPSIADEVQETILDNYYMYNNSGMMGCIYSTIDSYSWSLSFKKDNSKVQHQYTHTHTFNDSSIITIKYFKNCIYILNNDNLFMYVVKR